MINIESKMVNTKNMKYNKELQIKRTPCYINLRCNNINKL